MKEGDFVMYMGHLGIIMAASVPKDKNHWHVWFFDSEKCVIIHGSLMQKIEPGQFMSLTSTTP